MSQVQSPEPELVATDKPANNKALSQFLTQLKSQVSRSESIDVVKSALDKAIDYPNQLRYNNTNLYIGMAAAIFAAIGYWFYLEQQGRYYRYSDIDFGVFIFCIISLVVAIYIFVARRKKVDKVSRLLRDETLKHLYNMTDCQQQFLNNAENKFVDFKRGNYSQDLEWGKEIDFHSDLGLIRASVVYHHYVDRRTETYTESDGKGGTRTRTRTVYDHYYRQGVILPPLNKTTHLVISESRLSKQWSQSFMPASREFEKNFRVQANSQFDAAKFLEPAVVVACEQLGNKLKNLTIEFAHDGSVLINQHNTNLLNPAMDHDITNPAEFKEELLNDTSLFTVNSIFGFVNQIIRHTN
ncbi:DUF3137 domain-containing protein [uncultured Shewanella sp.]|uniref:DUF3137 domain-containing protein n=1 Tax=uncultured Shewanella sp. TaxID=173975 RepID=UPI00261E98AB|nr:DUF3137 domain-containing protein [uncultured Shewanella sp.]